MLRFVESVLDDAAVFYDFVYTELHGRTGVGVYSDEPMGSNYSCFDYSHEGCDATDEESWRFIWEGCKLTMAGDALYWESKKGKNAALSIYAIKRVEIQPKYIKVYVAPTDSCKDMGVVEFHK